MKPFSKHALKRFLEHDLAEHGVIADREVQICPRLGNDPAELVDILVHAIPIGDNKLPGKAVTVVIEVKCAWNNKLLEDIEQQLFNRYLKNDEYNHGIYVVACFTCAAWNWENDVRKTSGQSQTSIDTLRQTLTERADLLSNARKKIQIIVIDARLNP